MPLSLGPTTALASSTIEPARCAALIDACGTSAFPELLLDIASQIAAVEEIFAWERRAGEAPQVLAAASWLDDQQKRITSYAGRFFRSDPLVEQAGEPGFFLYVIGAAEIGFAEYRQICFDRPNFEHKMSFVRRQIDHTIVLNFYLKKGAANPDQAVANLSLLANLAIASLLREGRSGDVTAGLQRIEGKLKSRFPVLSPMECAVLARLALAFPPRDIARSLGIKPSSVKTYRARASAKLDHSDIASVLARVIA